MSAQGHSSSGSMPANKEITRFTSSGSAQASTRQGKRARIKSKRQRKRKRKRNYNNYKR